MSSVHNSVETVNAAATAIVTADSRTQPHTLPKKKWGSCWSQYWCFGGSYKHKKRIRYAALVPEPTEPVATAPVTENPNHSTSIAIPFIVPPSSPASFLLSDPPSAAQSPAGLLSLKSLSFSAYSPGGTPSIFTIGPYAHETQIVTPPVFSAVTTEPSTACFTPPPETVQLTTPPSPEVPFAQFLASSLACNLRNGGAHRKFSLSQYEFQPYQYPAGGSRVGSGSLTPNGWGSRLGSGAQTPNGGLSRLDSGTVTPYGVEPPSRDSYFPESQISEVASLANSDNGSEDEDVAIDHHRVSFELTMDDVPSCCKKEHAMSHDAVPEDASLQISRPTDQLKETENSCVEESRAQLPQKHRNITLGSSKDFDFDNAEPQVDCEWWTSDKPAAKESDPRNSWTFFPVLKHEVS